MRKLILASTVLLLIVGQAMAQSTVWMELEIGGSNNGATCDNKVAFTPGSNADGTVVEPDPAGNVTWGVRIHASGTNPADGLEIRGVANYVFDLELYRDSVAPENLVNDAAFAFASTANTGNCGKEADPAQNPTAQFFGNAAFPYVFTVDSTAVARVFDPRRTGTVKTGGPYMNVHCYPKAAAGVGQLFGMGAGYSAWVRGYNYAEWTTGGIGKGDAPSYPKPSIPGCVGDATYGCLGWGPVAEGQLEGLTAGTYVLRLIPGGGVNVLRNQAGSVGTEVFALAAGDASQEDTITFVVIQPQEAHILGWSSVRAHVATEYGIPLDPAIGSGGVAKVETRSGGVQKIMVDFDREVDCCYQPGHVVLTGGLTLVSEQLVNSNQSLEIVVANSADKGCYTVDIAGAISSLAAGEDTDCRVRTLLGDANNDQSTNLTDMARVKSLNGQPASVAPECDVNLDGQINLTDMALVKSLNGSSFVCP